MADLKEEGIEREVANLDAAITSLHERVGLLVKTITPVLKADSPQCTPGNQLTENGTLNSSLYTSIVTEKERVLDADRWLANVIARIQL